MQIAINNSPVRSTSVGTLNPMATAANPMATAARFLVLAFLYATHSRAPEFLLFHGIPYTALLISILTLVAVALAGDPLSAIKSPVGLLLIAFTIWVALGTLFSISPGDALEALSEGWFKLVVIFFFVAGGLRTFRDARLAVYAIAFAALTIVAQATKSGYTHAGRLVVSEGTFANPNNLACYLLIGIPFCVYALSRASKPGKLLWMGILLLSGKYLLNTGSRGSLVALGAVAIYVFMKATMSVRMMVVAIALAGFLVAPFIVPPHLLERYSSMFSDGPADTYVTQVAQSSQDARIYLAEQAMEMTRKYPVFGVGVNQFPLAHSGSSRGHVAHNTYLQLSGETGIPGVLLYVAAMFISVRTTHRVIKKCITSPALLDVYRIAFTIRCAWLLFMITALFGNMAFEVPVLVLFGITEVLRRSAELELPDNPLQPAWTTPFPTRGVSQPRSLPPLVPGGRFART